MTDEVDRVAAEIVAAKKAAANTGVLLGEGDDRVYWRSVPRDVAAGVEARLQADGHRVSWAPDSEDPSVAWLYA